MFRALWSALICVVVTVVVSMITQPRAEAELDGLVYGATVIPHEGDCRCIIARGSGPPWFRSYS